MTCLVRYIFIRQLSLYSVDISKWQPRGMRKVTAPSNIFVVFRHAQRLVDLAAPPKASSPRTGRCRGAALQHSLMRPQPDESMLQCLKPILKIPYCTLHLDVSSVTRFCIFALSPSIHYSRIASPLRHALSVILVPPILSFEIYRNVTAY